MAKLFGGLIGFFGSLALVVKVWVAFIVPLVPAGDYHGLILFGMGVLCVFFFGGLVFLFAMLSGVLFGVVAGAITGDKF
jgi:O-antigen ligase